MKIPKTFVATAVALGVFMTGAVAQHGEHHEDQVGPSSGGVSTPAHAPNMEKADAGKMGGMMSAGMMPQMMMHQNEAGNLIDQLVANFAAIESERNPSVRNEKLVEHGKLLHELQTKVQAQSHMMDMMQRMMGGSAMDGKTMDGKTMGGMPMGGAALGEEHRK